jgi:adenosylhomocysteinase
MENYKIKDIGLAEKGRLLIDWAESRMPVLMFLREKYAKTKPLEGLTVAGCLHVTKETAVLVETIIAAGAEVSWSGCNPLSTNDEVAAALAANNVPVFAWHGMNKEDFYWAIDKTIEANPDLTLDDGADLIFQMHSKHKEKTDKVIGGTEETTTGVHRLRAMGESGKLLYPIIAVNDTPTKWQFDNVYGTGQSTIDGILRATSILIAGKSVVVAGYGHCGRGVALRSQGLGAKVIVTEVDPVQALKATLEGHNVMTMEQAASIGDIFVTATGVKDVITSQHFELMKDGAVVCNTGHYDVEINIGDLENLAKSVREVRPNNEEYLMEDDRRIFLLAKGRLVNLAAAEGHPSEVMDMSFANQLQALIYLKENSSKLDQRVHDVPEEIDTEIATLKLKTMGMEIDELTPEQLHYLTDYSAGT